MADVTGLQIGQILDTEDPNGGSRVQVLIPALFGTQSVWASLCHPLGPRDSAMVMPGVGDEVLVGFVAGDSERPVILGRL